MEIKGMVHCMFEQSGTFKKEFIKLGYHAEDYDIQNNYGETDHVIDLFAEIDNAYEGKASVFDSISKDDLIMAFYPCIYFCAASSFHFYLTNKNYRYLTDEQKIAEVLKRSALRHEFYDRLVKFCGVVITRGLRMILENPWSEQTYLKSNFLKKPDLLDEDRRLRGDYFKKPTAFWFWNCEPTDGYTYQRERERRGSSICRRILLPECVRKSVQRFLRTTQGTSSATSFLGNRRRTHSFCCSEVNG